MGLSSELLITVTIAVSVAAPARAQEPPNFREIVQPYVDRGLMAGANGVVVNKSGCSISPIAGYADLEAKKPMQRDTLFWIASTSKTFQATALMMLVDEWQGEAR